MLGLYVGLLPHQTNIVMLGNGKAERQFDLYVEPVSNSINLIVIYGANIRAKFGRKFVRSNRMAPVHEQKKAELVLFKLIKRRQARMRQQQRILRWQSAIGKYNVGNVVVERIRSFRRLARNSGWWDLVWTSYIDKWLSLMCPAKIMAYNSPDTSRRTGV